MIRTTAIAAVLMLSPALASAASIDQTLDFTGGSLFSQTFTFDLFDGPGTLQGVTLAYQATAAGTVQIDECAFFEDCEPGTYTLEISGTNGFASISDSDTDTTGFTNTTDALQSASLSTSISGSETLDPLDFIGAGTFSDLTVSATRDGFYQEVGFLSGGTVTLTYDVAPIPLPAGLPLALGGLALLAGLSRRRRG